MSGAYFEKHLFCAHCNKITLHHISTDSSKPGEADAQCEHFGPRMVSGLVQMRVIGKTIYWFLQCNCSGHSEFNVPKGL